LRKLRALRVWLQDRAACGQEFDVASFTPAMLEKYIRRLDERATFDLDKKPDDKPDGVVPEFKDMTKWPTFEERLLTANFKFFKVRYQECTVHTNSTR
jgi:hypothetical protein